MTAAFLGTPSAALPALAALADVADIGLVVTRPDKPRGRSGRAQPPPVKIAAREWGFDVAQPETADDLLVDLQTAAPDVVVVVAYGRILAPEVLATSAAGFLNVHFSLLPRWRGAAPVERAILEGDTATGVSLMVIDEGLDTGPVLSAIETPIADDETGGSLTARLSYLGAKLIDDVVPDFVAGRLQPAAQLGGGVKEAPRLSRAEAQIDGTWHAERAARAVRAFHPRPGAWIEADGERVRVLRAASSESGPAPGVVEAVGGEPVLGLSGGALTLLDVQPAGSGTMQGRSWMNGRRGQAAVVGMAP